MIPYTLIRNKRTSGIRLKISPSGDIIVTASPFIPELLVRQFVNRSRPWIAKHLKRIENQTQTSLVDWKNHTILFLGEQLQLIVDPEATQIERVQKIDNSVTIKPASLSVADGPKTLNVWLKNQAIAHISKQINIWKKAMGASYSRLRFSQQSTRWGSCSASGTLSFNWRLIHFSKEVIDYVIIHELAHTFEMNHSQKFWGIVKTYCPDYKNCKQVLSKYNSTID